MLVCDARTGRPFRGRRTRIRYLWEESIENGHWIALLRHGDSEIIYDSYGRDPKDFAPSLADLETTERDAEQPMDPSVQWCGQACIAVCMICKEHGIAMARLV